MMGARRIRGERGNRKNTIILFVPLDMVDLDLDGIVSEQIPKDLAYGGLGMGRIKNVVEMGAYELHFCSDE